LTTLQYNSSELFRQKNSVFLKMKWCLYLQDIERAMKKAAAEAATLAEKIRSS